MRLLLPQGGMCSVFLQDTEKVVSISSEHLEPVTPTKNNKVRLFLTTAPLHWTQSSVDRCIVLWVHKALAALGVSSVVCGASLQVKVILGEDREATGILLSIDGDDGIVRMELDDQLKILNLRFLGKLEL